MFEPTAAPRLHRVAPGRIWRLVVAGAIALPLVAGGVTAASQAAPAPVRECNASIPMADGALLRANIERPAGSGRYPVVLSVTPYGKDGASSVTNGQTPGAGQCASPDAAARVAKGYVVMLVDSRGSGTSQGRGDSFGAQDRRDFADMLDWIVRQPWSNGRVGVTGCSALGNSTLKVAWADEERVRAGKKRSVFAAWSDSAFPDFYRDLLTSGGVGQAGVYAAAGALGYQSGFSGPPNYPTDIATAQAFVDHLSSTNIQQPLIEWQTDDGLSYDGPYYDQRSPARHADVYRIPVVVTAEWQDFAATARGQVVTFEGLRNAPKRHLILHPGGHCATTPGYAKLGFGDQPATITAFFDRYLKGRRNGFDKLPAVNMLPRFDESRWLQGNTFPLPGTEHQRWFLSGTASGTATSLADGSLSSKPVGSGSRAQVPYNPASGATAPVAGGDGEDMRAIDATSLTYTTPAMTKPYRIAGLITAKLWAALSRTDGALVAYLSDVAPDGSSQWLSTGQLRAALREVDEARSTFTKSGVMIRPFQPFTKAVQQPVSIGTYEPYLLELIPTAAVVKPGHRLRLTVTTGNFPAFAPSAAQATGMAGGIVTVAAGGQYDSHVQVATLPVH